MSNAAWSFEHLEQTTLTQHARRRMLARSISPQAVAIVLRFGREVYNRGAFTHVLGYKEVNWFGRSGLDLSAFEGIHVVCSPDGAVMTVYRNRDLKGLRRHKRRLQSA